MNPDSSKTYIQAIDDGLGILSLDDAKRNVSKTVGIRIPKHELKRLKQIIENYEKAKANPNITADAEKFLKVFRLPSPIDYADHYREYIDHKGKRRLYIKMRNFSDPNMLDMSEFKKIRWAAYYPMLRKVIKGSFVLIILCFLLGFAYDIRKAYRIQSEELFKNEFVLVEKAKKILVSKKNTDSEYFINELKSLKIKCSDLEKSYKSTPFKYRGINLFNFAPTSKYVSTKEDLKRNIDNHYKLKTLLSEASNRMAESTKENIESNTLSFLYLINEILENADKYSETLVAPYKKEYEENLISILYNYANCSDVANMKSFQHLMQNSHNKKFLGEDSVAKILNTKFYKEITIIIDVYDSEERFKNLNLKIDNLIANNRFKEAYNELEEFKSDKHNIKKVSELKKNLISLASQFVKTTIAEKTNSKPCSKELVNEVLREALSFDFLDVIYSDKSYLKNLEMSIEAQYCERVCKQAYEKLDDAIIEATTLEGEIRIGKKSALCDDIQRIANWASDVSNGKVTINVDKPISYIKNLKSIYRLHLHMMFPAHKVGFWRKEISSEISIKLNGKNIGKYTGKYVEIYPKENFVYEISISNINNYIDIENLNDNLNLRLTLSITKKEGVPIDYVYNLNISEFDDQIKGFTFVKLGEKDEKAPQHIGASIHKDISSNKIERSFKKLEKVANNL